MGTYIGNAIGLVAVTVLGIVTFVLGPSGLIAYLTVAYVLLLGFWIVDWSTRPRRTTLDFSIASDAEYELYQMFHVGIRFPGAGEVFSALLNFLRVCGLAFAVYALFQRAWISAVALVGFFALSGGAIVRFNPWLYAAGSARQGDQNAAELLSALVAIRQRHDRGLL